MADIKVTLELDNKQYIVEIEKSKQAARAFEKDIADSATKIQNSFGGIISKSQALAATFLVMAQQTMAFADEMADLAAAHDTTASSVLAFGKALAANGGKAESAGRAYLELAKSIQEANSGNFKTLGTFEKLGVSIRDLGSLSETELRNKLIKGLEQVSDPAERAAMSAIIFGKALSGVDIKKLSQSIEENNAKFAKYEPALQSAAQAYDTLAGNITNLKIAFAQAFKPIFDLINYMGGSNIDAIAVGLRHIGVALGIMASAALINGLNAVRVAIMGIGTASAKNPLLLIGMLVAQLGLAGMEMYNAWKGTGDEVAKAGEETNNAKRDQDDLNAKLKQSRLSLEKITEQYKLSNETALKKLDIELQSLNLTEDEKKIRSELSNIEIATQGKLIDLKNTYNSMDRDMQARQKSAYEEQIRLITQQGDEQKRNVESRLRAIEQEKRAIEDIKGYYNTYATGVDRLIKSNMELAKSTMSGAERLRAEENLNAIISNRNDILKESSKYFAPNEAAKLSEVLADSLQNIQSQVSKMSGSNAYSAYLDSIRENLKDYPDLLNKFNTMLDENTRLLDGNVGILNVLTEALMKNYEQSRTWQQGWKEAFAKYKDDATNAAMQAKRVFDVATRGMEDAIVNFVKTGKFNFKDLLNTITEELLRSQIRQLIANLFPSGGSSGGGSIFGAIGKLFGFADGGSVPGGRPILVGERGPELFVPSSNGTVVPNGALGQSTNVTYNISAVDARSFQALVAQDPQFIHAVAMAGARSIPQGRR